MPNIGDKVRNRVSKSQLPVGTVGVIVPVPQEYANKIWATNGVVWVVWAGESVPFWSPIQDLEMA